jgi:hypothetical protein
MEAMIITFLRFDPPAPWGSRLKHVRIDGNIYNGFKYRYFTGESVVT